MKRNKNTNIPSAKDPKKGRKAKEKPKYPHSSKHTQVKNKEQGIKQAKCNRTEAHLTKNKCLIYCVIN